MLIPSDVHYEFSKQSGRTRRPSACLGPWFQTSRRLDLSQGIKMREAPFCMLHEPGAGHGHLGRAGSCPEAATSAAPVGTPLPSDTGEGTLAKDRTGGELHCLHAHLRLAPRWAGTTANDNRPGSFFPDSSSSSFPTTSC